MNILNTYTVSTTDKLDLGLKPNEAYFIKKIDDGRTGPNAKGASYEVHYAYAPKLLTDGEPVSK